MKLFILTLGCLVALAHSAYVYNKPREHLETLNENFEQIVSNYASVNNEDGHETNESFGKKGPVRNQCSSKCCK